MQNAYRDFVNNLHLVCVDSDEYTMIECVNGWILSDFDTYHKCPHHYDGQPNPEEIEMMAFGEFDPFDRQFTSEDIIQILYREVLNYNRQVRDDIPF